MNYVDLHNAADAERSAARIADIELGLTAPDPADAAWWRDKARARLRLLEEDLLDYGLVPHELAELERLNQLVGPPPTTPADVGAILISACLCSGLLVALSFWNPA